MIDNKARLLVFSALANVAAAALAMPSSYLGNTSTRCAFPTSLDTAHTWAMCRSLHVARDNINGLTIGYANTYVTNLNVETSPGAASWRVAVEYPIGTITPAYDSVTNSSALVSLAGNTIGLWTCAVVIPKDAVYFLRVLQVNAAGIVNEGINSSYFNGAYESYNSGTGSPTDQTQSGTMTANASAYLVRPCILASMTRKVTLAIVGDSRAVAIGDHCTDMYSDCGEIARCFGPYFGYTNLARSSTLSNQITAGNMTLRLQVINGYVSNVINESGVNDTVASTGAQIAASRTANAALWPTKPTWGCTIYPETNSTDGYVTTTNQTPNAYFGNNSAFNAIVRSTAGIPGEAGTLDLAAALDPLSLNVFPVSRVPNVTSGVCYVMTASPAGVHMITVGILQLRDNMRAMGMHQMISR